MNAYLTEWRLCFGSCRFNLLPVS